VAPAAGPEQANAPQGADIANLLAQIAG